MLRESILHNWEEDIEGRVQVIGVSSLVGYHAFTIKYNNCYGVVIPYKGTEEVNERFAGVKIRTDTMYFDGGSPKRVLVLTATNKNIKEPFASLCEDFISAEKRTVVEKTPLAWWREWKMLLGNKNIDERIYDVLGELCVLKYLIAHGENALWNGPDGSSYDIECENRFVEVKSSIKRNQTEATISSEFQLFPKNKSLDLIFCRFEPTGKTGISIDAVLADLEELRYDIDSVNDKLDILGFEKGMSARRKQFILLQMLQYEVDESFPRITPESFDNGMMPKGIQSITFKVDLTGLHSVRLL